LVCSYNWQNCKETKMQSSGKLMSLFEDSAQLTLTGHAPIWQDIALPVTLSKDEGIHFVDQNAARAPQHPFKSLFQTTALMNSL
jgi:hypothetical protein